MAKSLAQIQAQIDKLQKQAEAIKAKEVGGVIARIREAISHYGLTAEDLGFAAPSGSGSAGKVTKTTTTKIRRTPNTSKVPRAAKYKDDAGNSWSGVGKRPNWFKAALAAGKLPSDLAV